MFIVLIQIENAYPSPLMMRFSQTETGVQQLPYNNTPANKGLKVVRN